MRDPECGLGRAFYAAVVSGVAPTSRATASALALLIVNLIGLGTGPIVVGALSDYFATSHGTAEGLRWALVTTLPLCLVSAALFWNAGKTVSSLNAKIGESRHEVA